MKEIEKLTADFIAHCKFEKNLSEKTIKAYNIDLKQFNNFLTQAEYADVISSLDKILLRKYIQSISDFKPKTIKRKLATIKSLLNFLEFEDVIVINPFRKMKIKIKESKELPKVMTLLEVEKIFKAVYLNKEHLKGNDGYADMEKIRDIAVIELLFATGARVSEISGLKACDIDIASGNILLKGKGNKERIIQLCNSESKKILVEYYKLFKEKIKLSEGYFLVNRFNKRLSEQSIRYTVKKYTKSAGFERIITPHVFRHSFATLLLEEQVDIKYIQHFLGHSSILTTQIYTHVNRDKQKEILTDKHPRKKLFLYDEYSAIQ